jgi:hypothetical protein
MKAIRSGRIARGVDGQIDFERADREWAQNTTPHMPYAQIPNLPHNFAEAEAGLMAMEIPELDEMLGEL